MCYQRLHRNEAASALLLRVFRSRPSDASLLAIVCNNLVALNGDRDVFDSRKKMRNATSEKARSRLFAVQQQGVDINQALLLLLLNSHTACREQCAELEKRYPER